MAADAVAGVEETGDNRKNMQILVVLPRPGSLMNPNTISLEVSSSDTVASLKARLQDINGNRHIPASRQRLVFAGSALPDDNVTTLADLGVGDSSTVHLVETGMDVYVRDLYYDSTRALYGLSSTDTVDTLKARYEAAEGVPADRQRLTLLSPRQVELENGRTLGDYGVGDRCSVYHRRLRWRQTDAFMALGRVLAVKVCGKDTMGLVKRTVKAAVGVPVAAQRAYHHGCSYKLEDFEDLEDGRTMEELGVMVRDGYTICPPLLRIECRQQQQADVVEEEAAEGHLGPCLLFKGDLEKYYRSHTRMQLSILRAQAARNEKPHSKPSVRMTICLLHVILEAPDPLLP